MNSDKKSIYRVALGAETTAMLRAVAEEAGCSPNALISSIVHAVLLDDLAAHSGSSIVETLDGETVH